VAIEIRRANQADIDPIFSLVQDFAQRGSILPREKSDIVRDIQDWLVAEDNHGIVACVSLLAYSDELSEVRSLIVKRKYQGNGVGSKLLSELIALAKERQQRELFALTREAEFFRRNGFSATDRERFPEKIWLDCRLCPIRDQCDEETMALDLAHP
jgi:amino-acid N-acetyltransferase